MEWLKELLKDTANADSIAEQIKAQIPNYFVPKDKYNTKVGELKTLNDTLVQRDNDIKALKEVDPSELQGELQTLQTTYATEKENWEKTLKQNNLNSALELALMKNGAKSTKALKGMLDMDKIKYDNDTLNGLDEQIKTVKEEHGYLFNDEKSTGKTGGTHASGGFDAADTFMNAAKIGAGLGQEQK